MNKQILFLFLLFCLTVNAQNKTLQIRVDTSYFPYQENIQMIQIKYTYIHGGRNFAKNLISNYNYLYTPIPDSSGLIDKPATNYIFRNQLGEIISIYNHFDERQINKEDLRSPDSAVTINDSIASNFGELFIFYHLDSVPAKKKNKIGSIILGKYKLYGEPTIEYYGKQGLINRKGEIALQPEYDDIFLSGALPIVVKDSKIGFLDQEGNPITPIKFKDLFYNSYGYIKNFRYHIVSVDSLIGVIDSVGNTLLDFNFKYFNLETCNLIERTPYIIDSRSTDTTKKSSDNFHFVVTKEGKKGFINARTFEYPISLDEYDDIDVWRFGGCKEFLIQKNGRYGYVKDFEKVIPIQYDTIIKSYNGNYLVIEDNFCGLYNAGFEMKLATEYDTITENDYGFLVEKGGQYGFYNNRFELEIPINCDTIMVDKMMWGLKSFIVKKEELFGVYNWSFKLQIPIEYDTVIRSFGEKFIVKKDAFYGLYGLDTFDIRLNLPAEFDTIIKTWDGYIVKKNNLYGFYNNEFSLKIPILYQDIKSSRYDDNLFDYTVHYFVKKDSLYALFNEHFKQVTPFKYDEIIGVNALFKVKKGAYYTILDFNLKTLCKPILKEEFEYIAGSSSSKYFKITTKEGKIGVLGIEKFLIKPIYDEIRYEYRNFNRIDFYVRKGKRWKRIKAALRN